MQIVVILLLAVGLFAAGGSVGWKAAQNSRDAQELARKQERDAALQAAAAEIAKIDVRNTTINRKVETLTREVPVYKDCQNTPEVMSTINEALKGGAK